jgi:hypothetical protein
VKRGISTECQHEFGMNSRISQTRGSGRLYSNDALLKHLTEQRRFSLLLLANTDSLPSPPSRLSMLSTHPQILKPVSVIYQAHIRMNVAHPCEHESSSTSPGLHEACYPEHWRGVESFSHPQYPFVCLGTIPEFCIVSGFAVW